MIIRLLVLSIFGFLSCTALASDNVEDGANGAGKADLIVADNRRKNRRDDRGDNRDDKQDCRQDEGLVGDDKRECKQENRGDGNEAEDDEKDKDAETDA
jgi:hypothetical protein